MKNLLPKENVKKQRPFPDGESKKDKCK